MIAQSWLDRLPTVVIPSEPKASRGISIREGACLDASRLIEAVPSEATRLTVSDERTDARR